MAERAAGYLESHPEYRMVILAGSGHIAYGSGIPQRLARRIPVSAAVVLVGWRGELGTGLGDYLLLPQERDLPAAGRIGAFLDEDDGRLEVSSCTSGSACEKAGLKSGDQILALDGQPITSMADLKLVMWDKSPGDRIEMEIRRKRWLARTETADARDRAAMRGGLESLGSTSSIQSRKRRWVGSQPSAWRVHVLSHRRPRGPSAPVN